MFSAVAGLGGGLVGDVEARVCRVDGPPLQVGLPGRLPSVFATSGAAFKVGLGLRKAYDFERPAMIAVQVRGVVFGVFHACAYPERGANRVICVHLF